MDIEKIAVRNQLNRMVWNYCLMEKISDEIASKITACINSEIGGGDLKKEVGGKVIEFPKQRISGRLSKFLDENGLGIPEIKYKLPEIGIYDFDDCENFTISDLYKIEDDFEIVDIICKTLFEASRFAKSVDFE